MVYEYEPYFSINAGVLVITATSPFYEPQTPTQVVRTWPIGAEDQFVIPINQHYQTSLAGSVFENDQLISVQGLPNRDGHIIPLYFANTTLETFVQKGSPLVSDGSHPQSSCVGCHQHGPLESNPGQPSYYSDFSFLFNAAQ